MIGRKTFGVLATAAVMSGLALLPATSSAQSTTSTHYTGTTSDGGQWIADIPSPWNGTLLLYSHGFGPPVAADAPDPVTEQDLLDEGYALAGSSYDPNGSWWALDSALTRPVPDADRREGTPPAITATRDRGRDVDGRADQLPRGRALQRTPRRVTDDVRDRRRRRPAQQLPAGRRVRDDQLLNPNNENVKLVGFDNNPGAGLASGYALDGLAQQAPDDRRRVARGWRWRCRS